MRVKRGSPKLISGVLLPSFILNYILIRVKERGLNKKIERTRREREKRSRRRGKHQALRINLLDFNSSVEVGYGFHAS